MCVCVCVCVIICESERRTLFFEPNRYFPLRIFFKNKKKKNRNGRQVFTEKEALCLQIPSPSRCSCGLQLMSIRFWPANAYPDFRNSRLSENCTCGIRIPASLSNLMCLRLGRKCGRCPPDTIVFEQFRRSIQCWFPYGPWGYFLDPGRFDAVIMRYWRW